MGGCRVAVAADTDDGRGFAGDRFLDRLADRGSLRSDLDRRFGDSPLQGAPPEGSCVGRSVKFVTTSLQCWLLLALVAGKPEAVPKVS